LACGEKMHSTSDLAHKVVFDIKFFNITKNNYAKLDKIQYINIDERVHFSFYFSIFLTDI